MNSQHPKPESLWIICCGMNGSGSTVQYLLTKEIVEKHGGLAVGFTIDFAETFQEHDGTGSLLVVKSHRYSKEARKLLDQGRARAVYIFRDIRDSIANAYRKNPDTVRNLYTLDSILDRRLKVFDKWKDVEPRLVSRYENTVNDLKSEALRISRFLELQISDQVATELAQKYSLEAQKKHIATFDFERDGVFWRERRYFDPATQLHSNHIGTGKSGAFQSILTPLEIAYIEYVAYDWLRDNGFQLTAPFYLRYLSRYQFLFNIQRDAAIEWLRRAKGFVRRKVFHTS